MVGIITARLEVESPPKNELHAKLDQIDPKLAELFRGERKLVIAEIGDITRFASSAKLARYTGCASLPVYSSDKERTACIERQSSPQQRPLHRRHRAERTGPGRQATAGSLPIGQGHPRCSSYSPTTLRRRRIPGHARRPGDVDTKSPDANRPLDIEASTACCLSTCPGASTSGH
jgi:hypothetical protein